MSTVEDNSRIGLICKRDTERKLNIQKQKDEKELGSAKNENYDFFEREFTSKLNDIENLLNDTRNLPPNVLPEHFNGISKEILILQKYIAASNLFLRVYDIKKYNDSIQTLTNKAKQLEEEFLPKKRFGFKNKTLVTNQLEPNASDTTKDETDSPHMSKKPSLVDENRTGFFGHSNETLCLNETDVFKNDVSLFNMSNCTIKIFGTSSTLHLNVLKNCVILCGPVTTSIFASNCDDCTLVIACQQLRLHSSKNLNVYLHITSRAIMEDCTNIQVAPYNLKYEGIEEHFKLSGLDFSVNNWQAIDDFNWLKFDQHSPNWKVLNEDERQESWY